MPAGPHRAGHGHPHARLPAAAWRSSAAASSTRCPSGRLSLGLRRRSRLPATRCSIRTSRSIGSSSIRSWRDLLAAASMVRYGAKALPEGGWNTMPRAVHGRRADRRRRRRVLNSMRLKGIHLAMRTGHARRRDRLRRACAPATPPRTRLRAYQRPIDASAVPRRAVSGAQRAPGVRPRPACRAWRSPALAHGSRGGRWLERPARARRARADADARRLLRRMRAAPLARVERRQPDRVLTFDKLTNVHYSGTAHDEDQPVAPAGADRRLLLDLRPGVRAPVHAVLSGQRLRDRARARRPPRLQINASNCVHCKTCDIMDPYGVITWVPPEGGGGPQYDGHVSGVRAADWRALAPQALRRRRSIAARRLPG